jgi:hypothetical protein
MRGGYKFLAGEEADQHFASLSRHNIADLKHRMMIKLWPGQYLGVYRHEEGDLNPTLQAKIRVIDITSDGDGMLAKLLDCATGRLGLIRHAPTQVFSHNVGVHFPHKTFYERTVKVPDAGGGGRPIYNIAVGVWVLQEAAPSWKATGVDCLDIWQNIERLFSDEAALAAALTDFAQRSYSNLGIVI